MVEAVVEAVEVVRTETVERTLQNYSHDDELLALSMHFAYTV